VKELGMPAVALTDHGNMHGAIDFYQKANASGIQPILGCEVPLGHAIPGDKPDKHGLHRSYHLPDAGLVGAGLSQPHRAGLPRVARQPRRGPADRPRGACQRTPRASWC
jgi:hypothetical protein